MSGRASATGDNDVRLENVSPREAIAPTTGEDKVFGVLSPEELEYARALRTDSAQRSKAQAGVRTVVSPPQKSTPEATVAKNLPAEVAMFDYVFQVATMRTEDSVDGLRQRLEGRGLRTRMQREGKNYYVLVMLRGNASRAAEVVQILDSMRLGAPLVRSRKPVMQ